MEMHGWTVKQKQLARVRVSTIPLKFGMIARYEYIPYPITQWL
jgi:hypothetical protein